MITPKQERNGVPGPSATHNPAIPGPDTTAEIAARIGQAEAAADMRKQEAASMINTPAGAGVNGHVVGTGGDTWDWDSGLAVSEMPGEA